MARRKVLWLVSTVLTMIMAAVGTETVSTLDSLVVRPINTSTKSVSCGCYTPPADSLGDISTTESASSFMVDTSIFPGSLTTTNPTSSSSGTTIFPLPPTIAPPPTSSVVSTTTTPNAASSSAGSNVSTPNTSMTKPATASSSSASKPTPGQVDTVTWVLSDYTLTFTVTQGASMTLSRASTFTTISSASSTGTAAVVTVTSTLIVDAKMASTTTPQFDSSASSSTTSVAAKPTKYFQPPLDHRDGCANEDCSLCEVDFDMSCDDMGNEWYCHCRWHGGWHDVTAGSEGLCKQPCPSGQHRTQEDRFEAFWAYPQGFCACAPNTKCLNSFNDCKITCNDNQWALCDPSHINDECVCTDKQCSKKPEGAQKYCDNILGGQCPNGFKPSCVTDGYINGSRRENNIVTVVLASLAAKGIETLALDVVSATPIETAVASISSSLPDGKGLDIFINNAGVGYPIPIADVSLDAAKKLFDLNVWSQITVTQAFLPLLLQPASSSSGGSANKAMTVNHSSVTPVMPAPFNGVCNASKGALVMFTGTMRLELSTFGISVVEVKTGMVRSRIIHNNTFKAGGGLLPEGWIYGPAREAVEEAMGQESLGEMGISAEQWAIEVSILLLGGNPPSVIWKGDGASMIRATSALPFCLFEGIIERMTKLVKAEDVIKWSRKRND
ncbi:short-chain dehydrogenase [Seiridium cupressi]